MDDPYRNPSAPAPSFIRDRRCLFCGGIVDEVARHCGDCGAPPSLELLSGQDRTVPCPRCDQGLVAVRLAEALVFQCDRCRGAFVAGGDWSEILDRRSAGEALPLGVFVPPPPGKELPLAARFAEIACPVCRGETERSLFADTTDVRIDVCPAHGAWFDAGELLRALLRVKAREDEVAAGGDPPAVPLHLDLYEKLARGGAPFMP